MKGLATGAALAAVSMAGVAARTLVMRRISPGGGEGPRGRSRSSPRGKGTAAEGVKEAVGEKVDQAGGAPKIAKEAGKKMLPSIPGIGSRGEDSEKGGGGTPGVGKGRRMPVQQSVDVGVPLSVAYNQWTQFEEWPQFMHRIDQVTQEDDCTVSLRAKVWGMSKESVAQIVEQRPDERIQWEVSEGASHTGAITFHELARNLTRIQVSLDLEPGTWIEKAARGMRYVKRAVRADLARFKAFIEVQEVETGAWRGEIHDGKVVKGQNRGSKKAKAKASEAKPGNPKTRRRQRSAHAGKTLPLQRIAAAAAESCLK